jgi:hypothetical protein
MLDSLNKKRKEICNELRNELRNKFSSLFRMARLTPLARENESIGADVLRLDRAHPSTVPSQSRGWKGTGSVEYAAWNQ